MKENKGLTFTFLGTGTSGGVPMTACTCSVCRSVDPRDKRLRTSAHISTQGKSIVIDSGPDFRQQMLREDIGQLDAILFTHSHKDHTGGLDDIRGYNYMQKSAVPMYLEESTLAVLKRQYEYIFSDNPYPGIPKVDLRMIDLQPFSVEGIPVIPIRVMHHRMEVVGFRFGDLAYITDANYIAPEEKAKLKGLKVLVLNALRHEKHISHFNLQEALELVEELQPEQTYFTHISHQLGFYDEVSKLLPDNVTLAYDGLQFDV